MASGGIRPVVLSIPDRPRGKVLEAAEPFISEHVSGCFGLNGKKQTAPKKSGDGENVKTVPSSLGRCPGEESCSWFAKSGGRVEEACTACTYRATKPGNNAEEDEESKTADASAIKSLIARASNLRQKRLSGYPAKEWQFTSLEFAALLRLDEHFGDYENFMKAHEVKTYSHIQAFFTGGKK